MEDWKVNIYLYDMHVYFTTRTEQSLILSASMSASVTVIGSGKYSVWGGVLLPLKGHKSLCSVFAGCRNMHLHIRDTASDTRGYSAWAQLGRSTRLPLPYQRGAKADTGEKVVHGAGGNRSSWRSPAFWIDLHRNVNIWTCVIGSYSKPLLVISVQNQTTKIVNWFKLHDCRRRLKLFK